MTLDFDGAIEQAESNLLRAAMQLDSSHSPESIEKAREYRLIAQEYLAEAIQLKEYTP